MQNKKKLVMVDFWSTIDLKGKPIGHGGKVGNEYYDYVKNFFDVKQYVNEGMLPYIRNPDKVAFTNSLKYNFTKITRIKVNLKCLWEIFQKEKDSVIWFYVPDIYLFVFLFFIPKRKRRLVVNVYEEYLTNKIKNLIFRRSLKKFDLIFVTNKKLLQDIPEGILIPDYAYNSEFYQKFIGTDKKEQVVCLGTMNEKKQLVQAVETFSKIGYPLYIVGQFASEEKFKHLCNIKADNITIENRFVDSNEYYHILSESKYCLIPYDSGFYKNRTSGVIQECLFCNTIPISHKKILEFSDIEGIGYDDIAELLNVNLSEVDTISLKASYAFKRQYFYDYNSIQQVIIKKINKLY